MCACVSLTGAQFITRALSHLRYALAHKHLTSYMISINTAFSSKCKGRRASHCCCMCVCFFLARGSCRLGRPHHPNCTPAALERFTPLLFSVRWRFRGTRVHFGCMCVHNCAILIKCGDTKNICAAAPRRRKSASTCSARCTYGNAIRQRMRSPSALTPHTTYTRAKGFTFQVCVRR